MIVIATEAIYARQSIDKKDSVSIESQIEMCKRFLKGEEFDLYIDKGFSAKNIDRPRMKELSKDISDGKVTRVIAYRLDRISRNIVDFGNLLTQYESHNVEFVSATENIDTSTPSGRAMVYIIMIFAQLERETIANRITDNYKFRSATGKYFMGGGVPFGYKSEKTLVDDKKASIITPNENAETLQLIFERYTSGYNLNQLVHELNDKGIKTSGGKLWVSHGLKRILRNITPCVADERIYDYLSAYGYNITNSIEDFDGNHGMCIFLKSRNRDIVDVKDQIVTVGLHEPIISSEQYIKAQIALDKNIEMDNKKTSKRSFLAGLVKCDKCGYSYGVKTLTKKNKTYAYYYCRGRHSRGQCTNDLWIKSEELENYIVKRCIKYIENLPENNIHEIEKKKKINSNDEIALLEDQINNLINNIGKGNRVVDELLTNKITELQENINKFKKDIQININSSITQNNIDDLKLQFMKFEEYDIDKKIILIKQVVEYITVSKDKNINIKFLF